MLTVRASTPHVAIGAPVDGATPHQSLGSLGDDHGKRRLVVEIPDPTGIDAAGAAALLPTAQPLVPRGGRSEIERRQR